MKHTTYLFAVPALALLVGYATTATAASAKAPEDLCPANVTFKSRVDPKLNALNLEDLTAASNKGNADATVLLGMHYTAGDLLNYEKAVSLFQRAANKKNADGEYYMGVAYLNGFGVPKDDAKATTWFRRSADHGHNVAQYWMGEMYSKGRGGITADWNAALPYFKKAALGAVPNAIVEIGIMYDKGLGGLAVDYEKSAACYRVADKLGSAVARNNLALMVGDGRIQPQPGDPQKADEPPVSIELKK